MKKTKIALIVGLLIVGSISLYAVTVYAIGPAGMRLGTFGKQGYGYTQMGYGYTQMGYGYTQTLETKAKIFDMTSEELQKELVAGKTMLDIAEEKGITLDQWQEKMLGFQKERLQDLVKAGLLTQEQVNARIQIMEQYQEDYSEDWDGIRNTRGLGRMGRRMGMRRAW